MNGHHLRRPVNLPAPPQAGAGVSNLKSRRLPCAFAEIEVDRKAGLTLFVSAMNRYRPSCLKKPSHITRRKAAPSRVVFLFDVDDTLLDNDQVQVDLQKHLAEEVEARGAKLYWAFFEELRRRLGYADYLGALQRFRREYPHDLRLLAVSRFLIDYPFANRLYANSLDVLKHVGTWGRRRC